MANAIKIICSKKWYRREELENYETIEKIAKENGYYISKKQYGEERFIKFLPKETPTVLVTRKSDVKFLCLSDLHIGSSFTDEKRLEKVLETAEMSNIKYVFISGDLTDGVNMYRYQELEHITDSNSNIGQARRLVSIFERFDLSYYAISGNHDIAFEVNNMINPNILIEYWMKKKGKFFQYLNAFSANLVIDDFAIRIAHMDKKYGSSNKEGCRRYFERNVMQKKLLSGYPIARYERECFPIKIVQLGHLHRNSLVEYHNTKNTIYLMQPGSTKYCGESPKNIGFFVKRSRNRKFSFEPV